ncbi:MAG: hypothetical protein ACRC6U_07470 [Fusobacteriaceae bacterium]
MKYLMHKNLEIPYKLAKQIRKYFQNEKTIETEVVIENKKYKALVEVESFLTLTNFDCFNCTTNCCVQFPYEFNEKSRKIILENLQEYDNLTKAVSILKDTGSKDEQIIKSILNDSLLIPEEHVNKTFKKCTCSCSYLGKNLCALHKICVDKGMSLEETIDTKPLWCSIYPLEIISENDESLLYIFVPNEKNEFISMNDTDFSCMKIEMAQLNNFKKEDYKPFILSYYSVLKYILGENFTMNILKELNLKMKNNEIQYNKKI